jgi:UDP-GlcNAc:undecaprenyl-phosphate GlcNAc-1-phosphate transferase
VIFAAALLISAGLALVMTPWVRALAERLGIMDRPGARKVHSRAVARLGGLAVAVSATIGATVAPLAGEGALGVDGALAPMLIGAALVFAVGLWDDVRGAAPGVKILVQAVAAALVIGSGATIDRVTLAGTTYVLGVFAAPVTLLWILAITNAFNLLDGLDGLAAGLAVIAAATCVTILIVRGHTAEAVILLALVGAMSGFLPYNFHPASIFLGDSGSLLIGFVLAVTAITGWQKGATALAMAVPVLTFALPIADMSSSVARRLRRTPAPGSSPAGASLARLFQADQEHIHHRLLAGGLTHRGTVLLLYVLSLALSGLALLTFQWP